MMTLSKICVVSVLLAVALTQSLVESRESVAELRRLRRGLGSGAFHGGDNGRDHPQYFQNTVAPQMSTTQQTVPSAEEEEAAVLTSTATTSASAPLTASATAHSCWTQNLSAGAIVAIVFIGLVAMGGTAVTAYFFFRTTSKTRNVAAPVPTKEIMTKMDEDAMEDATAASEAPSHE